MTNIASNEIKFILFKDGGVEVQTGGDVPFEFEAKAIETIKQSGLKEDLNKSFGRIRHFSSSNKQDKTIIGEKIWSFDLKRKTMAESKADVLIKNLESLTKGPGDVQYKQSNRTSLPGLSGWSMDPNTGSFHHSTHGVISPFKSQDGSFGIKHGGKVIGQTKNIQDIAGQVRSYIGGLSGGDTGMANVSSDLNQSEDDDVEKSGYGPKGMSQYNPVDNIKRKARNTGAETGIGPNLNTKSYSTKPGQLTAQQQAAAEAKRAKQMSGPVKRWSPEQIAAENAKRKVVKSIRDHIPTQKTELEKGEDHVAERLAQIMLGKGMLNNPPPSQPTDEQMFGGMVVSEQELAKKESEWGNSINNWLAEATKPISSRFASEEEELAYWSSIKIQDDGKVPEQ
jgi:hypothetical protein